MGVRRAALLRMTYDLRMFSLLLAAAIAFDTHCADLARNVVASEPFESAAIAWTSSAQVKVRVSADGVTWSPWITPAMDGDSDRSLTAITHFGAPQRFIEYAFDGAVSDVTVTTFPPAARKARAMQVSGIRTRVEWGCPEGESSQWTPQYTKVTHAVVHHTAGALGEEHAAGPELAEVRRREVRHHAIDLRARAVARQRVRHAVGHAQWAVEAHLRHGEEISDGEADEE